MEDNAMEVKNSYMYDYEFFEAHYFQSWKYKRLLANEKLMQQKNELGLFVACDEKGKPLPTKDEVKDVVNDSMTGALQYKNFVEIDLPKALPKVLFDNWAFGERNFLVSEFGAVIGVRTEKGFSFMNKHGVTNWKTIEDLVKSGITLSATNRYAQIIGFGE
jgi:hypothetical protein